MSSNITDAAPGAVGVSRDHPCAGTLTILDREKADVVETAPDGRQRKKIAVCGFAASSRGLAPYDDPSWSIWGLNQLYRHIPREDRHFDIHANWREDNVEGTDHPAWLAKCGIPVYMGETEPSIPTSVRYPLEEVIQRVTSIDYFTSTVSFMLGLAILEIDRQVDEEIEALTRSRHQDEPRPDVLADPRKFRRWLADRYSEREIGIFGIDLIVGKEYDWQKACVEFILGLAQARNITIRIPAPSALLKQQWRYGYEKEPQAWPLRLPELQKRAEAISKEREQLIARLHMLDGAAQENSYWLQIFDLRLKGGTVKLNEET